MKDVCVVDPNFVICWYYNQYVKKTTTPLKIQNRRMDTFIKGVNEIIVAKMKDEGFGVSELAKEMNISRTTLHRKIKSGTGQSVSQLIRDTRLKRALELLENEPLTVAEAAYMTGFRSATYFSKCFREKFGYPPVEAIKQTVDSKDLGNSNDHEIFPETAKILNHFPIETTSFIGRDQEIVVLIDLIRKHRIVTLTGPGGCGKTRLACRITSTLVREYPDGIWFVNLASLQTADLVVKQLMTTLGLSEIPEKDMMKIVEESIRDKRLLILLDNCEHLLITCAEITRRLIESVPGLTMVVTSREALNIKGEKVWIVPSLTLVDPEDSNEVDQVISSESVRLFTDRAKLNNPSFKLSARNAPTISTICRKVDGMPLAIELVAGRTRHMDAMTMLERLSDRLDRIPSMDPGIVKRHRTIQAAIEWSYNLLTEEEKNLFRKLSVFSGGFDLIDAETICTNESMNGGKILDLLTQLVEKSMIQTFYTPERQLRYKLLVTLQSYGTAILADNGEEEEIRMSHLEYYKRKAKYAYEEQFESQSTWSDWLEKERDNLVSALNWAESNATKTFAEFASYLSWFWRLKADLLMGMNYLKRALPESFDSPEIHARILLGLGLLTWTSGDSQGAVSYMHKSIEIWRNLELQSEIAIALSEISEPLLHSGERDASAKYSAEALELARKLGIPGLINHCLIYYCTVLVHTKQYDEGEPLVEELLLASEEMGHIYGIETGLHLFGDCAVGRKDYKEGEKRYAMAVETSLKYGNMIYVAFDVQGVAFALAGQGRYAKAIRLDAAAREMFKKIGITIDGMVIFWDEWIETYIESAKKKVGKELVLQYRQEGINMGPERAVEYALDLKKD